MSSVVLQKSQTRPEFYEIQDQRNWRETGWGIADACIRQISYTASYLKRRCCCLKKKQLQPLNSAETGRYKLDALPWSRLGVQQSDGLTLFLHGLNENSEQWQSYTDQMPKAFPGTHFLAVNIFKTGNCPRNKASGPVIEVLENYLRKFPGKKITLITTSNGACIGADTLIRTDLNLLQNSEIQFFSIAGAFGGTILMNYAHKLCPYNIFRHDPDIISDLSDNSPSGRSLVNRLQKREKKLTDNKIKYTQYFFGTLQDEKIIPRSNSFPFSELTPPQNYHLVSGYSHETIVNGVQKTIFDLMKSKQS